MVLPRSGRGGPGSPRLLLETLAVARLDSIQLSTTDSAEARYIWGSTWKRTCSGKQTPPESGGNLRRPSKQQRAAGGTSEDGRAKRPKKIGQPSYAIAPRQSHRVAIVCEDYPKIQVPKENFLDI